MKPLHTPPGLPADAFQELRDQLESKGGSLVLLGCSPGLKNLIDVWPDPGDSLPLMRRIKHQFDPGNSLSPGRFAGGI